jgi:hypothetical protein
VIASRVLVLGGAGAVGALSLSGCLGVETTPEKSAAKARAAARAIGHQQGMVIGKPNASVKVEDVAVVQDPNGVAAVVRVKNMGSAQATLPVGITVRDARGSKMYENDQPGLDASLTSLPVLGAGQEVDWVNNQILVNGRAAKASAVVGAARARAPDGALPRIVVSGVAAGHDADGWFAKGAISNMSSLVQKRVVVSCVARDGARVIAAARGVIDRLAPASRLKKPARFTVFFIGDPKQARLSCAAPPTVLAGGTQ